MVKEKQNKYLEALQLARQEYSKRSFTKIIDVSGGERISNSELTISYCRSLYRVNYPQGEIRQFSTPMECEEYNTVQITDQILILQYLGEVSGLGPSGKWISFLELPGGAHHYAPFKYEAISPLIKRFGSKLEQFSQACQELGGHELTMGDKAYALPVFPKLELAFVLWTRDEEFPPRATILFDSTACMHLNTAGLYMLGINTTEKIIEQAELRERQNGTV